MGVYDSAFKKIFSDKNISFQFIKAFYKGLLERHKLKKVALIAAMKRMVLIAHGVYRSEKPFTYDYEKIGREEKICA